MIIKKPRARPLGLRGFLFLLYGLYSAIHFAGFDAFGAYVGLAHGAAVIDPDSLNVCIPFAPRMSHGMRHIIAGCLTFSANFTSFCHIPNLLLFYFAPSFIKRASVFIKGRCLSRQPRQLL